MTLESEQDHEINIPLHTSMSDRPFDYNGFTVSSWQQMAGEGQCKRMQSRDIRTMVIIVMDMALQPLQLSLLTKGQ